ncbi:AMP-binding protein [Micromonospora peucetia]|uniref:AMP-binding protein n=1 Tax=Micromonospora peucetia TaxID=47871 RepID=A0A1C6U9Y9_9ACTN|nr:AMP-binding protein [Micromonospora peucetia]WSA33677.1 AMP-binding protein [Micromonospora peucetia]SCL50721.1 amino acid adenylation domain-containing protein [Micromonospora peucetia]
MSGDRPTRAELRAQILAGRRSFMAPAPSRPAPLSEYPDLLPMTEAQRRLWFADRLAGPLPVFTLSTEIEIRADRDVVAAACRTLLGQHAALRSAVVVEAGVPSIRLRPAADFPVSYVDLGGLSAAAAEAELARYRALAARYRFDLEHEPLVRFTHLRLPDGKGRLLICVHHLTCDGESLSLLAETLSTGQPTSARIDYPDYAVWRDSAEQRAALRAEVDRAVSALGDAPYPVRIPADFVPALADPASDAGPDSPQVGVAAGAFEHDVALPAELYNAVRTAAQARRTTDTVVLFAAWARVVAAWTGRTDLVLGLPISVRDHEDVARIVGLFVNTALVRVTVDPHAPVDDTVAACTAAVTRALGTAQAPLEVVRRGVYGPSANPLTGLGVCFNKFAADPRLMDLVPRLPSPGAAELPVVLEIADDSRRYHTKLVFDPTLYRPATIARLARAFHAQLAELTGSTPPPALPDEDRSAPAAPGTGPSDVEPTGSDLLAVDPAGGSELLDVLRGHAVADPTRMAVDSETGTLTRQELRDAVDDLTDRLRAAGARPGDRVVVDTERGVPALIGLLACLAADTVYVPLSRRLPGPRRAAVVEQSAATWEITDVGGNGSTVRPLPVRSGPELPTAPGYLIFTSGSTGVPRGVHVATGALLRHARGMVDRLAVRPADRYLQFAEHGFDAAIEQVIVPLLAGATLVLRGEQPWDPAHFGRISRRTGVTVANLPTPWFAQFTDAPQATWSDLAGSALRIVLAGGDALTPEAVARWAASAPQHIALLNAYGPTESVITATVGTVALPVGGAVPAYPSIGAAVPGHEVLVVDARLGVVAPGEVGELFAGGPLATGYLADPRATALGFVPHPTRPGERLYRTGDLVRHSPAGGGLEFLRRADDQVKVRGVRIELGDVEAALRAHPDVVEAVATVTDGPDRHFVGWVVLRPGRAVGEAELRTAASGRLPQVGVPRRVHVLDHLPRSAGEKPDRQALRERITDPAVPADSAPAAAEPAGGAAAVVAALAGELLATTVEVNSDFFACGGDSLSAAQLAARCAEAFHRDVDLATVFAHPTPERLAAAISALPEVGSGDTVDGRPVPRQPEPGTRTALTPTQQRFWFAVRLQGPAAQVVPIPLRLAGPLDLAALRAALVALLNRHGVLRSRIVGWGDGVRAEVHDVDEGVLAGHLTLRTAQDAAGADRAVAAEIRRSFDLRESWFRPYLTVLDDGEHVLHLAVHHIAVDGDSVGILVRELLDNYRRARRGEPLQQDPVIQYPDVAWSQEGTRRASDRLPDAVRALAGTVDLDLSAADPDPGDATTRRLTVPVDAYLADAVARRHGVTPYSVVMAAWQRALARWSGCTGFAVGLPVSLRDATGTDIPGPFLNTAAVRAVPAGSTRAEHLARVQESLTSAYAYRFVPFDRVAALAGQRRDRAVPMFRTMVGWEQDHESATVGGLRVDWFEPTPLGLPAPLVLTVTANGRAHTLAVRFDSGQVGQRRAADLVDLLVAELGDEAGAETHVRSAGATTGVLDRLADRVARQPGDPAALQGERVYDFAELDRQVGAVAAGLRASGVGRGDRVLVSLSTRLDTLVVVYALWRLGAVYVPLGPTPPVDRVRRIASVSAAGWLVADRDTGDVPAADGDTGGAEVTRIAWPLDTPAGPSDHTGSGPTAASGHRPLPSEAAYIIHTSGSTGEPKGVVVEHGQLAAFLDAFGAFAPWAQARCLVGLAAPTFDASVLELCWPALRGGPVVYPTESVTFDPASVVRALATGRGHGWPTAAFATPSLWREVLRLDADAVRDVAVGTGGEPVPADLLSALDAVGARPSVFYGPAEATIICAGVPTAAEPGSALVGVALTATRLHLLDDDARPAAEGEAYVAGPLVSRGYVDAPRETALRFVPDPEGNGTRMYRTGDRLRRRADGVLVFVGRRDDQVKVRGVRIELGEVQACLTAHPGVEAAAVVLAGEGGTARLVAAVVARDPAAESGDLAVQVRSWAESKLVPQAVPVVVPVPALPVSENGKIDRQALLARLASDATEPTRPATLAGDPVSRLVTAVWQAHLHVEVPSATTDFFEAGGHSIALLHVVETIERIFSIDFPIARAFEARTVTAMADEIRAIAGDGAGPTASIALEVFGGSPQ